MDNMSEARENLAEKLKRWYVATMEAIGEAKLLASLDDETVKLLAQDCSLTPQELRDLIWRGPHASDEMLALMDSLGIDRHEAQLAGPAEFRDMHVTCAYCGEKAQCRKALVNGTANTDFGYYCGNTDVLLDLWAQPELRVK